MEEDMLERSSGGGRGERGGRGGEMVAGKKMEGEMKKRRKKEKEKETKFQELPK